MTVEVNIKELLGAGAHFGHKTSRWHPKMAPYIYAKRQDAHIINLEKTVEALEVALPKISEIVKNGKKVLFVGTKKQISEIVRDTAESVEMPYVTLRWVGGTLTNVETVNRQIRKLKDLEKKMETGELETRYSKLEVQRFQEEIDLLNARYGGIKDMSEQPAAIIVADAIEDKNAIKEAKILGIPVFAITDTNVDPSNIDYVIPMNDDALKATELVLGYFADAVLEGKGLEKLGSEERARRRAEKLAERRAQAMAEELEKTEARLEKEEQQIGKAEEKTEAKEAKIEAHEEKKIEKVEEREEKKAEAKVEKIEEKAEEKLEETEEKLDKKKVKAGIKAEKDFEKGEKKLSK